MLMKQSIQYVERETRQKEGERQLQRHFQLFCPLWEAPEAKRREVEA